MSLRKPLHILFDEVDQVSDEKNHNSLGFAQVEPPHLL